MNRLSCGLPSLGQGKENTLVYRCLMHWFRGHICGLWFSHISKKRNLRKVNGERDLRTAYYGRRVGVSDGLIRCFSRLVWPDLEVKTLGIIQVCPSVNTFINLCLQCRSFNSCHRLHFCFESSCHVDSQRECIFDKVSGIRIGYR